jgi:23S rRNA (cytosine1962-C5)-methyltransferase
VTFAPVRVSWPRERLICINDKVLVVDKPRGLPVHGGSPDCDDVVTRLARFCRERGEPDYLAVHSRLDKDVSGVIVFGRSTADNPAIAREFESHSIIKRYVAIVRDVGLPARFEWRDRLQPSERGPTRVVSSGGLEATTEGRVRARHGGRALVELQPKTGRRHQLRAQLAHHGAPIAGDTLYGGDVATRLMLHATSIESKALGWHFESAPSDAFASFGEATDTLGTSEQLRHALVDAAWLREPLFRSTDVLRLVNASGDALPGMTVDRFSDWAVVELLSDEAVGRRAEIVDSVMQLGPSGVYVKCRVRRDLRREDVELLAPSVPDAGEVAPAEMPIAELGIPYEVRLGDGWDVGLYLDQRENRRRVRESSGGRAVLNLFGYTGSFSVAAALGGARRTLTVDLSSRALERARRNFEVAGIATGGQHEFVRADVVEWLSRSARSTDKFDLVVLDPPSFSTTGRGRVFRLTDHWDDLLMRCLRLLNDGGQMLVISHERSAGPTGLRRRILRAAERAGHSGPAVRELPAPVDFPAGPAGAWPSFALWVQLR